MKFKDLPHVEKMGMIYSMQSFIEQKAEEEDVYDYLEPTDKEYEDFFDAYDEDYIMGEDGFYVSMNEYPYHNTFDIEFKNGKAILLVLESHHMSDKYI